MLGEFLGEVPVGISNRHVHICRKDLGVLFGPGADLTVMKRSPSRDSLLLRKRLPSLGRSAPDGVRILGMRSYTQVESPVPMLTI